MKYDKTTDYVANLSQNYKLSIDLITKLQCL